MSATSKDLTSSRKESKKYRQLFTNNSIESLASNLSLYNKQLEATINLATKNSNVSSEIFALINGLYNKDNNATALIAKLERIARRDGSQRKYDRNLNNLLQSIAKNESIDLSNNVAAYDEVGIGLDHSQKLTGKDRAYLLSQLHHQQQSARLSHYI